MKTIYLDHQATTPLRPEVLERMRPFLADQFGNASSLHRLGLEARDALAIAREQAANFINASSPEEIIFTSGGTEAINLAIKGAAWAGRSRGDHLVVLATDQPAVLRSAEFLATQGFRVTRLAVDGVGRLDPAALANAIKDETILVVLHHANHELGTMQPVDEVGRIVAERGVPLLVDATMSGGWAAVDVQQWGASLVALAPHRFFGPKGAGILYRNRRARLTPLLHGGEQEDQIRAGTENLAAIVGAGLACELAGRELPRRVEATRGLQTRLCEGLRTTVPYFRLNGPVPGPERLPTLLNVSFEFVEGEGVVLMLDVQGIAVASGSACASRATKASAVLKAIGLDHRLALGSVLFSPGPSNTTDEIEVAVAAAAKVVDRLRGMSPAWDEFQRGGVDSQILPRVR